MIPYFFAFLTGPINITLVILWSLNSQKILEFPFQQIKKVSTPYKKKRILIIRYTGTNEIKRARLSNNEHYVIK
jgi:hypothetical protein